MNAAVQGLVERGLIKVEAGVQGRPVGLFTEVGIAALRQLALDRRQLDPARYAQIRQ